MSDEPDDEMLALIEAQLRELRAADARNTPNERYAVALALLARRADTGHPTAQHAMERLTAKLPGLQAVLERVREIQEAKHAQRADELNYAQTLLREQQKGGYEWAREARDAVEATDVVSHDIYADNPSPAPRQSEGSHDTPISGRWPLWRQVAKLLNGGYKPDAVHGFGASWMGGSGNDD